MSGGANAHHSGIKAFSETDFTDDLKSVAIPVLVLHGEDDPIVPFAISGAEAVQLLQPGQLISYPGFPHGMPATEAATRLALERAKQGIDSLFFKHCTS